MLYLSDEWFDAADEAVREAASTAPEGRVVIDQHVDDVRYRITIDRNNCSLRRLPHADVEPPADATFHQSRLTAAAIAQGATDAHQAFLLGDIRFEGDVQLLIDRRDALDWLANRLQGALVATTY